MFLQSGCEFVFDDLLEALPKKLGFGWARCANEGIANPAVAKVDATTGAAIYLCYKLHCATALTSRRLVVLQPGWNAPNFPNN